MAWTEEFWKPIKLNDGRSLATLGEARVLILSLPASYQEEPHWKQSAEFLSRAAASSIAMDDALAAMVRALKVGGLI